MKTPPLNLVDAYVAAIEAMLGDFASSVMLRTLADQHDACAAWLRDECRRPHQVARAPVFEAAARGLRELADGY